ncbi:hypothetical protein G9H71_22430 [Motilibacter sp. E257]|uniref:Uncharacterized protein n=2 Tax=Motilibacter deserti TaxID=2714956 RepID=A0ABX0H3W1_9ACTN|nr:hypothetical protein [Motilibacter deserti]
MRATYAAATYDHPENMGTAHPNRSVVQRLMAERNRLAVRLAAKGALPGTCLANAVRPAPARGRAGA